jgi:uncharacterized protein YydD (DUF2326 family)
MARIKNQKPVIDLHAIREEIVKHVDEGKKIISHYNKMLEYYSDWEDRLNAIDKKIAEAEEATGLTKDEIVEYDALAEALT